MGFPTLRNAKKVKSPLKKKYNNICYYTLSSQYMAASGSPWYILYLLVLRANSGGKYSHLCFSVEKMGSELLSN